MVLRGAAVLAAVSLCVTAGCGGDGDPAASGESADARDASVLKVVTSELEVERPGFDDALKMVAPTSIRGGLVDVVLVNRGESPHNAQLIRIEGERNRKAVLRALLDTERGTPLPPWIRSAGGVGPIQGGERATATQALEPGTYYVIDTEATGASGELNLRQGGMRELAVSSGTGGTDAELPDTDARIVADDRSFDVSGIEAGRNRVTFENAGDAPHQLRAFAIREGFDYADAEQLFAKDSIPELSAATSPLLPGPIVGTAQLDGGLEQVTEIEFEPGVYVLACFVVDPDGETHARKGMIEELDVE